MENLKAGMNVVTFKSFGVELVGNLYLPEGFVSRLGHLFAQLSLSKSLRMSMR